MATSEVLLNAETNPRVLSVPATAYAGWGVGHANLKATANTANELLRPSSITTTGFQWNKLGPNASRVKFCARWPAAETVSTNPIVRVISACGPESAMASGVIADTGTVQFDRLDTSTFSGTGVTLDCSAIIRRDGTYAYSEWSSNTLSMWDAKGGRWVAWMVSQAAVGTSTVDLIYWAVN